MVSPEQFVDRGRRSGARRAPTYEEMVEGLSFHLRVLNQLQKLLDNPDLTDEGGGALCEAALDSVRAAEGFSAVVAEHSL